MQENVIKTLYVIGNGFDLHHNIKSSYANYRDWLKEKHSNIYEKLIELYGAEATDKSWWGDFEENLGYVPDVRQKIEEIAASYEPDDNEAWDVEEGGRYTEYELSRLVSSLKSTFAEWVQNLNEPQGANLKLGIANSAYLSFNYTRTLEDYYRIPSEIIKHIHGVAEKLNFVLGHGRKNEDIIHETEAPIAPWDGTCPPSEYGLDGFDNENYSNVRLAFVKNLMNIRKATDQIIRDNNSFFEKLHHVEKVFFIGFSFSPVDMPYVNKIIDIVSEHACFAATYYSKNDYMKIINRFHNVKHHMCLLKFE